MEESVEVEASKVVVTTAVDPSKVMEEEVS